VGWERNTDVFMEGDEGTKGMNGKKHFSTFYDLSWLITITIIIVIVIFTIIISGGGGGIF
jgi:hypothetical protein